MENVIIKQVDPEMISNIKLSFFQGKSEFDKRVEILIIGFEGEYGYGSDGNADAQYMFAKSKFGINAFEPTGVILDFSDLDYQWGDMLESLFGIGDGYYFEGNLPIAIVLGDNCKDAVGTLIYGIDSKEPATTTEWIFDTIEEAWKYLERKIISENIYNNVIRY